MRDSKTSKASFGATGRRFVNGAAAAMSTAVRIEFLQQRQWLVEAA